MKILTVCLLLFSLALTPLVAQVDLPITFDDVTVNYDLTDFGGTMSSIVADPTGPGNLVAMVLKDTFSQLWAGTTMGDTGMVNPIPFSMTSTVIKVRVYSPDAGIPILLKVEDSNNGAINSEVFVNTTVANAWDTLVFDYSTGSPAIDLANTYDKISIFFNFGTDGATAGNKTYYWENVEFIVAPKVGMDLPITFDDTASVNYDLVDFGGNVSSIEVDPVDPGNLVGMVLKDTFAQLWAGTTMGDTGLTSTIPFTMSNMIITVRVYSPDAGIPILLKVEDAATPSISSEVQVNTTVANAWETLEFDFSMGAPALDPNNTHDKVSIFFNFGTDGATAGNKTYYWDDVEFVPAMFSQVDLPITFEDTATVDYDLTDFGGNMSSIEVDPVDPGNLVGMAIKTAVAQVWAGTTMGDMGLANTIPFTVSNKKLFVRVYSPDIGTPILLKVESTATPSISSEQRDSTTVANAWETLEFDFATGSPALDHNNDHDKVSIFFNFGIDGATAGAKTYYWDDVEFMPEPKLQVDLPITFQDTATVDYDLVDFGGNTSSIEVDPADPGNLVLMAIKDATAQVWAGTTMGDMGLANPIAFTTDDTRIQVRVYSPDAGIPILLKVEDTANGGINSEVQVMTTVANAWDTLVFDYSSGVPALNLANTYDKISIFFNFGTDGATAGTKTYYCDDVELLLGNGIVLDKPDFPITFQDTATVDYNLVSFGNSASSIEVDPVVPSNLVGMTVKSDSAEVWAGTTMGDMGLANPIPFSATDTKIKVRVYSPDAGIPVLLKVEDAANGGISSELTANTTIANAWDTLTFDFAGGSPALNLANTYDKISIFFNFGTNGATAGEKTYYWDDVEFIVGGGVILDQPELPITFQDTATVNYDLLAFGGNVSSIEVDPVDPSNLVGMALKDTFAQLWAGVTMGGSGLADSIHFTATDTRIQVRVYSPDAGIPILLKVEDAANGGISSEIMVNTTLVNAWDTLIFDFAAGTPALNLANTYDKISIFFNFGTTGAAAGNKTYYWDDVELLIGGGVILDKPELPITFQDTATVNYNLVDFGGNNSSIVVDPTNSSNLVGMAIKDSTAQVWAGTTMGGSGLENPIAFTATNKRIAVRVYAPAAGIPILLKVENAMTPSISSEVTVNTVVANAWQTLIFDYSMGGPAIDPNNTYDKISIFFNFGTSGAMAGQQTYYWDDVELLDCQTNNHVTGNLSSQTYEALSNITSDAVIMSPNVVIFKAGNSISLGDDGSGGGAEFEVQLGAEFGMILLPCGTN